MFDRDRPDWRVLQYEIGIKGVMRDRVIWLERCEGGKGAKEKVGKEWSSFYQQYLSHVEINRRPSGVAAPRQSTMT